jgi:hypothetical protein
MVGGTSHADTCRSLIDDVTRAIEPQEVREIITLVFDDLLCLLECLSLTESHLRKVESAEDTFELFQIIHDEAAELVDFIRNEVLKRYVMNEELFDTLEGIAFAVRHDLQRVFESDSNMQVSRDAHVVVGKLYRAHNILTNCLQQSTITLAMVFDPELVGARLFNNCNIRQLQSLQLCEDISALTRLVETAEANKDDESLAGLTAGIDLFRSDSMELLMYSDLPQFESFCERLALARSDWSQLEPILHQYRCYLETLLGQVKKRAVLTSDFPVEFGDHPTSQVDPFAGGVWCENNKSEWDSLAIAV